MLTEATVRCNVTEEHRSAGVWISMIERCLGHGHQESLNVGLWVSLLHCLQLPSRYTQD